MSVLDQAQNVRGVVSAARLRERWQQREAKASGDEAREQYREAIADLEARFPELENVPPGGAEAFARERGHGSGPVHEGRQRIGSKQPVVATPRKPPATERTAAAAGRKPVPGLDPTARRSPSSRKAAKGRPTPRVDRAIRQTGIPAAASSAGSTTMAALGATVGLSLFYLVLSSAEKPGSGAAALPSVIGSVTRTLHRFLSLEDVFPSNKGPGSTAIEGPGVPAGATVENPHAYSEGPGSTIAKARARLKAGKVYRPGYRPSAPRRMPGNPRRQAIQNITGGR
ncbi:MAG TPA: hypothetical protein VNY83_07505 [Solirubrobacterales bacterium]|nr:hypothetical protein [Solirubrobacterales bacterium]